MEGDIRSKLESLLNQNIIDYEMLGGGDSSFSYKLILESKKAVFFKYLENDNALSNICSEVNSLKSLADSNSCKIPEVLLTINSKGSSGLMLEWIDRKIADQNDLENFGRKIALLHKNHNDSFTWREDNFISILPQSNRKFQDWHIFYIENRILPLLKIGIDKGFFELQISSYVSQLEKRLINEVPKEQASLIHGDLWSGNFIIDANKDSFLIDPSCYYGHREMDIAMSLLFGSFGRSFYQAYQADFPLEKGFDTRLDIHQLYPLLVHAILFQGQYIQRVKNILTK